MRLGADTNLETLLHKLESAYGISFQDDLLMREFYDAQQKTDEDVTWCFAYLVSSSLRLLF
jgi:hypothetical protein